MADELSSDLASLKIDRSKNPDRRGPLRYAVIAALVVGAAAFVYFAVVPYVESRVFKTEVSVTEIALVSPAQGSIELTSTGYVRPQKASTVAAKIGGRVAHVLVQQGQEVHAGDVLFELEQTDQRAAIAAAQSRVAAARARSQTARANLAEIEEQAERAAGLAARGVTPKAQAKDLAARVRSLRQAVKAADAEVRAAQAEVARLDATLESFTVTAPIDGTIISEPPEIGEIVGPQLATGLAEGGGIEIADFSSLAVETDVPEQRLHMVQVGSPCEIVLDAFPGKRYRGTTSEIVPRVNRAKATVTVKVRFVDPANGVLPDMSARVSFLSSALDEHAIKEPPKLVVPKAAVVERQGANVVFVVEGDRVRMTSVEIGAAYGDDGYELIAGPPAGTRVVRDPPDGLADGQKVKEDTSHR